MCKRAALPKQALFENKGNLRNLYFLMRECISKKLSGLMLRALKNHNFFCLAFLERDCKGGLWTGEL